MAPQGTTPTGAKVIVEAADREFERMQKEITQRETERQRIHASLEEKRGEEKTARITVVTVGLIVALVLTLVAGLIWKSIDTPDPRVIAKGAQIECVVVKES